MPPHVATTSLLFDAESTSPFSLGKRHGLYLAPFALLPARPCERI